MSVLNNMTSKNVCVIGAGTAGIVSIHELRKEGHTVTCFESEKQIGGAWAYGTSTRSSIYKNLRTNNPKQIMAFEDFPFDNSAD